MPDLPQNTEGHRYNQIPKGAMVESIRAERMDGREKRRTTAGQANNSTERILTALAGLKEAVSFLTGQQGIDEVPFGTQWTKSANGTFDDTWEDFSETFDPSVTFIAPSSGKIRVDLSAYLDTYVNAYSDGNSVSVQGITLMSFDILKGSDVIKEPSRGTSIRTRAEVFGTNNANVTGATCSKFYGIDGLTPGEEYVVRARRGSWGKSDDANDSTWQRYDTNTPSISIVKRGM